MTLESLVCSQAEISKKLIMLSDVELGRIVDYIPNGAEYWNYARYCRDLRKHNDNAPICPISYPYRYSQWCKTTKSWNDTVYTTTEGCADLIPLSDIRAELNRRALTRLIDPGKKVVYGEDLDIYIVFCIRKTDEGPLAFLSSTHRNHRIEVPLQYIRPATPEEVDAGHRMDMPTYAELLSQVKAKDDEIKRLNAFIREKLQSPVLELIDGKFSPSQIEGMFEINGKWVYVTSQTKLAYEQFIGIHESMALKRIVF